MDFTALQTEFFARGFDYENDGGAGLVRAKSFINRGYQWICEQAEWPFVYKETTGASPLVVADMRENGIRLVVDQTNTNHLSPSSYESIRQADPTLVHTGTPQYWFLDETLTTAATVRVWPGSSASMLVAYFSVPTALTNGADQPTTLYDRHHPLIVDYAVKLAYEDNDNFQEAAALQVRIDADIASMKAAYLANPRERARVRRLPPQPQQPQAAKR